jgi:hypothetical protein
MKAVEFDTDEELDEIRDFIVQAECVEGPDELYDIVAELWPDCFSRSSHRGG